MLGFWIAAAIVSAATGAAVLAFARRARTAGFAEPDPALDIYERQLREVDDLAARGLIGSGEREAARTEASRRLLQAARRVRRTRSGGGAWAAPLAATAAPLLAMAVYLSIGRPNLPDQPHQARVAAWRAAPERLGPAEAVAVLETIVRDRPRDAEAHTQLGRARLAARDAFGAVRAFQRAAELDPGASERWTDLARGLLALEAPAVAEARRALARAQAVDPAGLDARYWLGQADLVAGDRAAALGRWRDLAAELPATDTRRAALQSEIAALERPAAQPGDPSITAMVEGLAQRLRTEPDDPQGWARLARAYAVLGREADLRRALEEARRLFAGRPEVLARIEAEATAGRRVQQGR